MLLLYREFRQLWSDNDFYISYDLFKNFEFSKNIKKFQKIFSDQQKQHWKAHITKHKLKNNSISSFS